MKCVNAVWELRNLGVKTVKFYIEKNDTPEKCFTEIEEFRLQHDAKYAVVCQNTRYGHDFSIFFQNAGFSLMDHQLVLKWTPENVLKAVEEYREFYDDVSYRLADETDKKLIFSELEKGIFKISDYIVLDPYFSEELKNRRFIFYVKDILSQGAHLFLSLYKDKPVGLFARKLLGGNKSDGLLSGIFNREETYHQGALHILAGLKCFIDSGTTFSKGTVSLNNLDILRLHLSFGAKVVTSNNVFVKHYD